MKNRKFACALLLVACTLMTLLALAGPKDFWEAKPYTDWTQKEVEKLLLNNSPWTYVMLLNAPGSAGGSSSKGGGGEGPPPMYFSWYARPIREAVVRQMTLLKPETPKAQLDAILNYKSTFLEMMVTGYTIGGGGGRGQAGAGGGQRGSGGGNSAAIEKFKEDTYLLKKDGKTKVPLMEVQMPKVRGAATFFKFAGEIDGKPSITAEDKEIRFVIKYGDNTYKILFNLEKMKVKGNLEIFP
jgi:hypothetical protein